MVQGFERREGAQDPNAGKPMEAGSMQMGMVMSPQKASFSGVGDDLAAIGKALGGLQGPLEGFFKKKIEQSTIEGGMMYAQGKAEEEVRATGNEYTVTGFMNMKARTDANMWMQAKQNEIADTGKSIDPVTYREQLSGELKGLMESVNGADDTTKSVLLNSAASNFAELVGTQTKAHALWKADETENSLRNLYISEDARPRNPNVSQEEADKDLVAAVTHGPELSGLPKDRQNRALAQAMLITSQSGSPRLVNVVNNLLGGAAYIPKDTTGLPPNFELATLAVESGGRRFGKDGKILRNEVSGALGEYQVLPSTLKDPGFGIAPAKDESPEEVARVGREYLRALSKKYDGNPILTAMAYHGGTGTVDRHLANGDPRMDDAVPWEKFIDSFVTPGKEPGATKEYLNKLTPYMSGGVDTKEVFSAGSLVSNLAKAGFEASDITAIQNSVQQQQAKKAASFDETRLKLEQQLKATAETDGNFDAGLKTIRQIKETMGLSDSWAEGQAEQLTRSIDMYQKTQAQRQTIEYANQTNTLGTLSKKEQNMGLDMQRAKDLGELQVAVQEGKLPEEQLQSELFKRNVQFAHKNGLVDEQVAISIQAAMTAPLFQKDGSVSKDAKEAFMKYRTIREFTDPDTADKYAGDSKRFLDLAQQYSTGNSNIDTALMAAQTVQEKFDKNKLPEPSVTDEEVQEFSDKFIENFDSSYFVGRYFDDPNALGATQVYDWEIEKAKEDPRLHSFIKQQYLNQRRLGGPKESVERDVKKIVNSQVDFVLGQAIISKPGKSIAQTAGINTTDRNALNKAAQEYLKRVGPTMWKEDWNKFQFTGSSSADTKLLDSGSSVGAVVGAGAGVLAAGKAGAVVGAAGGPAGIFIGGTLGIAAGAIATGGKGRAAVAGAPSAIGGSIADSWRGVPDMHVQYNEQEGTLIFRPYLNKERTEWLDKPQVVSLKTLGEGYKAAEKPETVSTWERWLDNTKKVTKAIGGEF